MLGAGGMMLLYDASEKLSASFEGVVYHWLLPTAQEVPSFEQIESDSMEVLLSLRIRRFFFSFFSFFVSEPIVPNLLLPILQLDKAGAAKIAMLDDNDAADISGDFDWLYPLQEKWNSS